MPLTNLELLKRAKTGEIIGSGHKQMALMSVEIEALESQVDNLSMLVRRLCRHHPHEKMVVQATGYLIRHGLQGSPLRQADRR